jgi:TonB family protein
MKPSVLPLLHRLLSVLPILSCPLLALGCAADLGQGPNASHPMKHRHIVAADDSFDSSAGAREMGVQNEVGVYESADIEETLAAHMEEVRGCLGRAGRARKYVAGKVVLRFMVSGEGKTQDVLVVATDLGNYDVERCLVDVGRRVKFPAPIGHKATTFEYPVEFRSTREIAVQDLDDSPKIDHDVTVLMHSLSACGAVTATGASASFYVEPSGQIGSVGLAGESVFDEEAGACMVREMRRWHMSATLPGRMLRCRANIPAVIASAEPPPSRRATLSAASRMRHR